jgi:SAM-dependent methyltransferase
MAACARLPVENTIVEVAAGNGRHAAALARAGRHVVAVDFVEGAIRQAAGCGALVHGVVADVSWMPLRPGSVESLLCTNFLERSLFGDFKALIRPGGFLIYETYTVQHLALVEAGRARAPRSAAYLLEPGELARLVAPFAIVDAREGYVRDDAGERYCASALAQKG